MTAPSPFRQRAACAFVLALAVGLCTAAPALAQTTSAVSGVGTFIQNVIDVLNSDVIRGLAIIAVIVTGIAWMFGHLDLRRAGTVIIGIIIIFSAATIVDLIVGGGAGG